MRAGRTKPSLGRLRLDDGARFEVDHPLPYVYFEDEPGRRSAAKLLTKDRPADCQMRHKVHCHWQNPRQSLCYLEFAIVAIAFVPPTSTPTSLFTEAEAGCDRVCSMRSKVGECFIFIHHSLLRIIKHCQPINFAVAQ